MTRLLLALALLLACGDAPGDSDTGTSSSSATTDPPTTGDPGDPEHPPTEAAALTAWLMAGHYKSWPSESAPHASTGPHFGSVRTYVNPALLASLEAQGPAHPNGAAAVKELYGNGDTVRGWSAMIKGFDASTITDVGDGWFWYENYDGSVFGDSFGDATCTGCHAPDHPDFKDFFLTPFPLQ